MIVRKQHINDKHQTAEAFKYFNIVKHDFSFSGIESTSGT